MSIRNKTVIALAMLVGLSGLLVATPSMAWGRWHHGYHWHHRGYYVQNAMAAGLVTGLVFGAMAGYAAAPHTTYYSYSSCAQRVTVRNYCRYDRWGYQHCYQVRRIQHFC